MKLNDAVELTKFQGRSIDKNRLPAIEVAKRVFELSARYGEPYEKYTPDTWRDAWLESDRFILAEIGTEQVGVPFAKKISRDKVYKCISAAGDGDIEPIVVDINRQQIGRTPMGYVPKVIVVDGKHRHRAQVEMGKDKILAWVGERAMEELQRRQSGGSRFIIEAASLQTYERVQPMSSLMATATLYSAVAPPASAITRQDNGDGGPRPTGGTPSSKWEAAGGSAGGATGGSTGGGGGMGGSLGGGSGSNPATMNVRSVGTSEGVEKEWDERGRGKHPLRMHWQNMVIKKIRLLRQEQLIKMRKDIELQLFVMVTGLGLRLIPVE